MKIKQKIITILAVIAVAAALSGCGFFGYGGDGLVDSGIDYREVLEEIDNPDRGFYRPIGIRGQLQGTQVITASQLNSHNHPEHGEIVRHHLIHLG